MDNQGPVTFSEQQQQQQQHPFKKTDTTDVIVNVITTSTDNGVQLFAHKSILSFYSPEFRDILHGEGDGNQQQQETMPTITITENKEDIIEFLKFFYPEYHSLIEIDLGENVS